MKKGTLFLILLVNIIYSTYAQKKDCNCETDLIFLDSKIRKTPAYKINKKAYNNTYSIISKKVIESNSMFECYRLLNELLISLNDNHSRVYGINLGATQEVIANPEKLTEFKNSMLFNTYPKSNINLDSLINILNKKAKKDIEGIYKRDSLMTIGVYKSINKNTYKAIILSSKKEVWAIGETLYSMIPYGNNYLLTIGGNFSTKRLIAYPERIENGFFHTAGFQKDITKTNYASKMLSDSTYYREELSDAITYLKIGSFNSWYPTLSDAETFYKSLKGNLKKPNLIIDLRNNGGGGDRNSDILYKLINEYTKNNKVYVLINHNTVSNAEQFAHKLSKLKNCQLFGERTNGRIAYEIKNSNYPLPCGNFIAVLTSKKHSAYLEFESQGVRPDVMLNLNTDWIVQVKEYISKNN